MKTHKDVYMDYFKIGPEDIVMCEYCNAVAVDIHHVLFKSQQGTNEIHNLIALCRSCHDRSHGKVRGKEITRSELYDILAYRED